MRGIIWRAVGSADVARGISFVRPPLILLQHAPNQYRPGGAEKESLMNRYAILFVIVASVLRLIPHPFGMTPINAAGLFAGSALAPSRAIPLFLAVVIVGDAIFGFYDIRVLVFVYAGLIFAPLIGRYLINRKRTIGRVASGVTVNALVFYSISNIGNWLAFYPHTMEGILANYIAGLPYLGIVLIGDGLYAAILFGGFEIVQRLKEDCNSSIQQT